MKKIYLSCVFKSHYCKIVFLIMLVISYFLLPRKVFFSWYNILAYSFIILFALTSTCLIKSIKDRVILQRKNHSSIWSIIFSLIGLSAFQVCSIGAPVCGISIGAAIVATILPTFAFHLINHYALYFIYLAIVIQLISLFQMKCFNNILHNKLCK